MEIGPAALRREPVQVSIPNRSTLPRSCAEPIFQKGRLNFGGSVGSVSTKIVLCCVLTLFIAVPVVLAEPAADSGSGPVYFVLRGVEGSQAEEILDRAGGRLLVFVPGTGTGLADLGPLALERLRQEPDLILATREPLTVMEIQKLQGDEQFLARSWQREVLRQSLPQPPASMIAPRELSGDGLVPPAWNEEPRPWRSKSLLAGESILRPAGATEFNTSEYLAGSVSINLILMESVASGGVTDEDWDSTLEGQVTAQALQGLADLALMHPRAGLSFFLHVHSGRTDSHFQVACEPIAGPADPTGSGPGCREDSWVNEILARLGYQEGSRFYRSRLYGDTTRVADGADWAVNAFVANSRKDPDGTFADGKFAYAFVGGPHIVLTSDNEAWGIAHFGSVLRHELHHAFFALDEYASSGCSGREASGYFAAINSNCESSRPDPAPCVMRDNALAGCTATAAQVGLVDRDGNGIPDILEPPPQLAAQTPVILEGGTVRLDGAAEVGFVPNLNPAYATPVQEISLLSVSGLEYQIDSGAWQSAPEALPPATGRRPWASFTLDLSLASGTHRIALRVRDSGGNYSEEASWDVQVVRPTAAVGSSLRLRKLQSGVELAWEPAESAQGYRVHRAVDPRLAAAGAFQETTGTRWEDVQPGIAFYVVTSIDGTGSEVK